MDATGISHRHDDDGTHRLHFPYDKTTNDRLRAAFPEIRFVAETTRTPGHYAIPASEQNIAAFVGHAVGSDDTANRAKARADFDGAVAQFVDDNNPHIRQVQASVSAAQAFVSKVTADPALRATLPFVDLAVRHNELAIKVFDGTGRPIVQPEMSTIMKTELGATWKRSTMAPDRRDPAYNPKLPPTDAKQPRRATDAYWHADITHLGDVTTTLQRISAHAVRYVNAVREAAKALTSPHPDVKVQVMSHASMIKNVYASRPTLYVDMPSDARANAQLTNLGASFDYKLKKHVLPITDLAAMQKALEAIGKRFTELRVETQERTAGMALPPIPGLKGLSSADIERLAATPNEPAATRAARAEINKSLGALDADRVAGIATRDQLPDKMTRFMNMEAADYARLHGAVKSVLANAQAFDRAELAKSQAVAPPQQAHALTR